MIVNAELYLTADRYNPTLRATVPGSWVLALASRLPGQSEASPVPEFYGNTKAEAKQNAINALQARGFSGVLRINRH